MRIAVDTLNDPRLDVYRNIRDRDVARRFGAFLIEGRVVLNACLDHARHPLRSVLVSERRVPHLQDVFAKIPAAVPVFVASQHVMDNLVGFPIHRGLLAAASRPDNPPLHTLLGDDLNARLRVLVLEGLTNHDNVGACFRNAAAFGMDAVLLDDTCCDPLYRKAIRVSAGHVLGMPFARASTAALIQALRDAHITSIALAIDADAQALARVERPARRLAIWLGTEGPGLSAAALDAADACRYIPMAPNVDSLNVAAAGAVAMFALR